MALNIVQTVATVVKEASSLAPLPGLSLAASLLNQTLAAAQQVDLQKRQAECITKLLDQIVPVVQEKFNNLNAQNMQPPSSLLDNVRRLESTLLRINTELMDFLCHGFFWRLCHTDRMALALSTYYSEISTESQLFGFEVDVNASMYREEDRLERAADSQKIRDIVALLENSQLPELVRTDSSGALDQEEMREIMQRRDVLLATSVSDIHEALDAIFARLEVMLPPRGVGPPVTNWSQRQQEGPDIEPTLVPSPLSTGFTGSPITPGLGFLHIKRIYTASISSVSLDDDGNSSCFERGDCSEDSWVISSSNEPTEISPSTTRKKDTHALSIIPVPHTAKVLACQGYSLAPEPGRCMLLSTMEPSWDPLNGPGIQSLRQEVANRAHTSSFLTANEGGHQNQRHVKQEHPAHSRDPLHHNTGTLTITHHIKRRRSGATKENNPFPSNDVGLVRDDVADWFDSGTRWTKLFGGGNRVPIDSFAFRPIELDTLRV